MAKSDRQRSLRSEEFFFDSEASLLDQHDFEMSSCTFNDVFDSRDSHTFLINVQVLLEAARFLESADRKDGSEFYCAAFDLFLILGSIKKKNPENKTSDRVYCTKLQCLIISTAIYKGFSRCDF